MVTDLAKQYTVRCKELLNDGSGLVNFNKSDFSVTGVLPGEKCNIELVYTKGSSATSARLTEVLEPSPERIPVKCPSYGKCGGCNLLHMSYESECKWKTDNIRKLFKDYNVNVEPIIVSEKPENYRNKVYASFAVTKTGRTTKIVSGMYEENTRKVVNCSDCLIQNKEANKIVRTITNIMKSTGTKAYDPDTRTGVLRHVYLRVSAKTGKVMVILVTGVSEFRTKSLFVKGITDKHPSVETIIHNINDKKTGMILGERSTVLYGKGFITDEICGLSFKISPKSFYQVNPKQAEKLYKKAIELSEIGPEDTVLDAYSGIGTISLTAAKSAKKVYAVENNHDAITDARANAEYNKITNVEFVCADAGEYLENEIAGLTHIDVLIMDPPRNGSDETFLKAAVAAAPSRIAYISCNPETQARDVKYLTDNGYILKKLQPVDMFSRTGHTENIALLVR